MQITASQLQSQHKALIDALKRGEPVEITYHGEVLGIVQPAKKVKQSISKDGDSFFGMHKDLAADSETIENEIRQMRTGRRKRFDDI
ncbi:hypothetical protein KCM76_21525 [Zooshikella marina]|uniref:hypothetical protein n=1 Tax=Zooshikella ganghwensis TaxID=202772 RepID=UPI001BB00C03|nr:hypothetical protein [Zooshikella ganghwensis]MBU2708587.1 hypothetical protein [Zooshikella ganghwensis]